MRSSLTPSRRVTHTRAGWSGPRWCACARLRQWLPPPRPRLRASSKAHCRWKQARKRELETNPDYHIMNTLRLLLIVCLLGAASTRAANPSPVMLANPLQGTDSNSGYSHGNEYPAIALPFPMNTWAPYKRALRDDFSSRHS